MKVSITVDGMKASEFEITKEDSIRLSTNSIERVINTAIHILATRPGEATIAEEDLAELKPLMVRLWYSAQQAVYAAVNEIK